jgi:hypothetical protein
MVYDSCFQNKLLVCLFLGYDSAVVLCPSCMYLKFFRILGEGGEEARAVSKCLGVLRKNKVRWVSNHDGLNWVESPFLSGLAEKRMCVQTSHVFFSLEGKGRGVRGWGAKRKSFG